MVIEPLKVVGVWVGGQGHWLTGTFVVAGAYAASLLVVEKLFQMLKPNILRAPLLAEAWRRFLVVRSAGCRVLRQMIPSSG
jgi:D-alanyl-lipoteichoic acid acyltransferase DltB (MBOAT superfamily)